MNEFFKTVEVWKLGLIFIVLVKLHMGIFRMTLEHHGCNFKSSGANGILQAFLLSLSAATFNSQCGLEIELNPETELHRTIEIKNLRLCDGGSLSLLFDLEPSLTPFVSLNASTTIPIYACTAGTLHFVPLY
jgi:hypothetical protein